MYKIPATTLFFGQKLIFMPECHSTNNEMLLLCQHEYLPEGTLIITAQQTAGRGQRGNSWEAEAGKNLTLTLLVRPGFLPLQKQFYLNIFASLGIRNYLTAKGLSKVQIKWPNDIICNKRKICGILIENQIAGSIMTQSVIGIGLNINQQQFSSSNATSVMLESGHASDLSSELPRLLEALEAKYLELRNGKYEDLLESYLKDLYLLNETARFSDKEGEFVGTIKGIDQGGRLVISTIEGEKSYDLKEIKYHN